MRKAVPSFVRRGFLLLTLTALLLLGPVALALASPGLQSAEEGKTIFQEKCSTCHTIGGGKLVGPDLQGVTSQREQQWLARWIKEPDKMLAEGDPIATQLLQEFNNVPMPNLGLTDAEVASLIAYLESQGGGETQGAPAPQPAQAEAPAAAPAGDPAIGRALFTGEVRFQNGGPACMSCHTVATIGMPGGGALGPDLTQAYNNYGDVGMASVLAAPPFPAMKPIFDAHPLTPEEQANLAAFLKTTAAQQPASATGALALLAVAVFVVLMLIAQLIWRRRLQAVRRPLVARA